MEELLQVLSRARCMLLARLFAGARPFLCRALFRKGLSSTWVARRFYCVGDEGYVFFGKELGSFCSFDIIIILICMLIWECILGDYTM